ncbi:DUF4352 domain-containing protein [Actinoplanes regularis]|uniref:DUF4352 domain-containing protein n=1 Tax=Actinoplanes regularis TaxID=52697 RepID=A0A239I619_9ACTN|nr:DUF4352 domain-containing protein [Actinoplanes regularis]GIE91394.1 hypothetical protein Are01nite_78740 [Actinoplanes regularis]SNS87784.1 protein of unknown function [Actinoplanes regularis]
MEIDQSAGVMRCPYCRREIPMPSSQPFGAGMPHVTISTARVFTQTPEAMRRRVLVTLAIVVAPMLVIGVVLSSVLFSSLPDSPGEPEEVAVGATARVQSFEATVRGVDCTKQTVTKPDDPATSYDDTFTEAAKGKFCVVTFSVKNVGEKTDRYPASSIVATNATERVLDRSTVAENFANNGTYPLDEPIDPGKTVDLLLVFDVPVDTTLAYLQISDDLFADAVIKVKIDS